MPRYMLDTNMCIYLMKNQPPEVAARFSQCMVGDVVMSSITYAELSFGVAVSSDTERNAKSLAALIQDIPVLPFDSNCGQAYGLIRLATRESKKDALNELIAAHAATLKAVLVTNNEQYFQKYPGIAVENWVNPA